ncbi:hypothetical protein [Leifsonia sp. fls2-241-R2A-40a]|uniref:hypothetical protein n=1 Tax=Leifsonia sp. fls2-241-R2A-40a TaxID=3040290 RepID=UPI00254EEB8C|nr:hypothetical protein [Leifsonia sp. fls2-241-R2A-40a]
MIHRQLAGAALVLLVAGGLSACSADDSARSSLSQSAGTAASAARAAGLVLGLQEADHILPTVMDTGLSDAADRLSQEAMSVSTMTAQGGIGVSRDRVLTDIRAAQDAVASAQRASAAGHDSGKALDPQRRRLDRLAQQLDAASKRLERG